MSTTVELVMGVCCRGFPQVDPPSQRSSMTRPSAKSIYMQRKEYSETMNNQPDNFQYRVEHLFTCELDGQEVRNLDDCVTRLQRLEAKGRVWGQEVILEVQGGYLQLNDIETKAELEYVPLGSVVQTKAVLDTCAYNSLLTVMVQERNRRIPQVFMFQCEEVGEILNHVLNDVELFMGKVAAPHEEKNNKKNKKKKSSKPNGDLSQIYLQSASETLVPDLSKNGCRILSGKPVPQCLDICMTHSSLLSLSLFQLMCHYPPDLPPSVLTPLLTEPALILLSQVVTPEEDQKWRALGDSWNIPRSKWPDGHMIPPYNPEFYDGWQPPQPVPPAANQGLSRSNSQHIPLRKEMMQQMPDELAPVRMRVIYDFMARNPQELSIMKGEVVQVVDKSGQWWRIRNERGEEGHVAKNVLEPLDGGRGPWDEGQEVRSPPPLNMQSRPAEVKAWLEYKAFSKITVRSLSVLNGALLLGMSKDEMRTVCPEEGGRVFFQLQAIKSSIAVSDSSTHTHTQLRSRNLKL
uniref:EPS8 signaling adaptor L3b n=1 Tax=Oncorhynchus mykiss TaxID=8022 RepID=A0A8C7P977_ONCMY